MSASHSPYNHGSVEGQDPKSDKKTPIAGKKPDKAGISLSKQWKDKEGQAGFVEVWQDCGEKVRAADYKRLDLSDSRAKCHSCVKNGVAYIGFLDRAPIKITMDTQGDRNNERPTG